MTISVLFTLQLFKKKKMCYENFEFFNFFNYEINQLIELKVFN